MNRLSIFYPVKPFRIFQPFGASEACTEDLPNVPITKRRVVTKVNNVCPFGFVELYPLLGMKGHTGIDMQATSGQPVYAATGGVVEEVQTELERGLGVSIITTGRFDMGARGEHFAKTRYWHLKAISVSIGQRVDAGDIIGYADSTGLSSGDHLHFELKPVKTTPDGGYANVFQDNGYYGAIDPIPFFNGYFAVDSQKVINTMRALLQAMINLLNILQKK